MSDIVIHNAKVHNLKGIDARIPRNSLTVITGLSGSGKSSLAFDTLYAEGQRRYVESLSAYARQFLDRMEKPDVEKIEGLSPAISIEQRTTSGNPRSIVATVTEIHDYLRILYGSIAIPHCPKCSKPVTRQSAEQIVDSISAEKNADDSSPIKAIILAPVAKGKKGRHEDVFASLKRNGFARVRVDGETYLLEEVPALDGKRKHDIDVIIDRLVLPCDRTRLTDSVELALKTGSGILSVSFPGSARPEKVYSELNACIDCGISFDQLKPRSFSFNSPFGACPTCAGLGQLYYFDENLVVPDRSLPLRECIHPWRRAGHNAIMYYNALLEQIAKQYKVSLETPYEKLPSKFRHDLMHGFKDDLVLPWRNVDRPFEGVLATLQKRLEEAEDEETRAKYEAYQSFRICPSCQGGRLNEFSRAAKVDGKTITEVMAMPVGEALRFFEFLAAKAAAPEKDALSGGARLAGLSDIISEIIRRLKFLIDVGLDYLTLDRASATLSGGEMQRIRLATQIGSGLTGVLYVLDEPTIGLHPRDNERLIGTLKELRDRGNTVVVVEHDEEMMKAADWIIDLGPGAGREGGRVMYQGDYSGLLKANTLTADYLSGRKSAASLATAKSDKSWKKFLTISGCTEHNLKNITARIPVGSFTVVSGVRGSGKSTLVDETLKCALFKHFYSSKCTPGRYRKITGIEHFDKIIEIDQSPIGRTPRSNPATYVGFFSEIRELFAMTEAAKARGYAAGRFSFNVKGGRCEVCGGDGVQKLEMSFLPDVYVVCEQCGGKRFNAETLEVTYGGKNIAEVLSMTVSEAFEFFAKIPSLSRKLSTLVDVGLGYIQLGQSATTLSGGEAQRIKLATELSKRSTGKTLYLLDEPTTGLHFDDISKLLELLLRLRDQGNTIVVIEHNTDVMKCADWIIDLGPGGGASGGELVCEGPVEKIRACKRSVTGKFI
ncbi:MAG: excinuclease ABC subunit UvrA [Kiritimatiellae bacterium]|nr:excinuclease ABC subunit UvrA [Kiritimatiellia bacterium]